MTAGDNNNGDLPKQADGEGQANSALSRRNILLAGTTLAAASAIVSGAPNNVSEAQAQQQPAPAGAP